MPASIKLQQEFGDDLQVVFVESQGADLDRSVAFAWNRKWMGTRAMWTTERPLSVEGRSLPKFALLGIDGRLLLSGNPLAQKKKIEEAIAEQIKLAKDPPAGTPRQFAKSWTTFLKGKVGEAIEDCDALAVEADLAEAAAALRGEMVARTQSRIRQAQWLIDNGYIDEAKDQLSDLAKAAKGCADFDDAIAGQLARLEAPDESLASEAQGSRLLAAIEAKMVKGKPFDRGNLKKLEKIREDFAGTHAATRAERLLALAQIEL